VEWHYIVPGVAEKPSTKKEKWWGEPDFNAGSPKKLPPSGKKDLPLEKKNRPEGKTCWN